MLLKRRAAGIDDRPVPPADGYEHLDPAALAVLRWLAAHEVDFVLVGAVARSLGGDPAARGPVAIVPAPYDRNHARLARALTAARARPRSEVEPSPEDPGKVTADLFTRGRRWEFVAGVYELHVERVRGPEDEARPAGEGYQALLWDSVRVTPATGLAVEVASPADQERYADRVNAEGGSAPTG